MSHHVIVLCESILSENFGHLTGKVGATLLAYGPLTLPQVCAFSKVRNPRKYLSVLVRHGLVSWDNFDCRGVRYRAHESAIMCRIRVASLVQAVGRDRGELCELICEEILLHGAVTETGLLKSVTERTLANVEASETGDTVSESAILSQVKTSFKQLTKDCFIHVLTPPPQDQELDLPEGDKPNRQQNGTGEGKMVPPSAAAGVASPIPLLWKVNLIRLQRCLLNHTMLEAVKRRFGGCGKMEEVMKAVISLVEEGEKAAGYANTEHGCDFQIVNAESISITLTSLNQTLSHLDKTVVNNYVNLLANDRDNTGFVKKIGDASGGQYVIDWYTTLRRLATSLIQSVIRERFGGESVRIFNVLASKGFLEQSEVERFCLLAGKDVKQQLYTMLGDGFLSLAEIPRVGSDYAPSRTSYFFSADVHRVANVVSSSCVQTLRNLMQRRNHEVDRQQNLLDRNDRLQNLKDSMRAQGSTEEEIEEVAESWMGVNDREQINQFGFRLYTLDMAEVTVDHTFFILTLFIKAHQKRPLFT